MRRTGLLIISLTLILSACEDQHDGDAPSTSVTGNNSIWSIPIEDVKDGGPGKDGIPSIDSPQFISAAAASLAANELVIGVKQGNVIRAYPHAILNYHEIVNDTFNNVAMSVSFCPLTGSALLWSAPNSSINKQFGVSGLLYNSNLILYDRQSNSNWSQMLIESVNGPLIGAVPQHLPLVETSWNTWQQMFPQTQVLSTNTGFSRNYTISPYGNYPSNNAILFPVDNSNDTRLSLKTRVLGIFQTNVNKVYAIEDFSPNIELINESNNFVVIGSSGFNYAVAFNSEVAPGTILNFTAIQGALPVIMQDNEGNQWDIFGVAVSGPRTGEQLEPARSFIAYWFAWTAFYAGSEIHVFN